MRQDPDESGTVPDDHLLVRPYVGPSGPPPQSAAPGPAWPQTGPLAFPGPAHVQGRHAPAGPPAPAPVPAAGRGRRSRLPFAVLTLLALSAVGALVLLLGDADPQPPRAGAPAELSVPVLPAHGPDSVADADAPGSTASVPSPTASASVSPTPSREPEASASRSPKPPSSPSPSAPSPPVSSGTLRMGDSGPEVRDLQELLRGQGFTYVSVTGVYDNQTKRGVGQLQRDRSIKGDSPGVYGPATQAAMR
ncbi:MULTISPECIES: peptidoglycan-binding domain-containing protein [Streptomyces]|uniref:peptidoglycan-binding domain-containing protein n=1 Tax=Streptomyces TaxID=1883 RepID=UPI00207A35BD|nr:MULTISPECIES: peptidoglycan-binding domain-containing protein [Streptomyces]MCM9077675.1 peptidoglycan-binding protein [Streptomyces spororaveus]MCX5307846.1 peptidoglycan-binding protein [Streptomyces sp. NBC_00160]